MRIVPHPSGGFWCPEVGPRIYRCRGAWVLETSDGGARADLDVPDLDTALSVLRRVCEEIQRRC